MRFVRWTVDESCDGMPLWFVLERRLGVSDIGVRRAKRVPGAITLDGAPTRTNIDVRAGQTVGIAIDDETLGTAGVEGTQGIPGAGGVEPQDGPLGIVYEDEDIVVLDKPADLVVHPCSGRRDGTLGNFLLGHFRATGRGCGLHPVHRLDQGTTGLIVFATSGYAQARLQAQLERGEFSRTYLAVCTGELGDAGFGDGNGSTDGTDGAPFATIEAPIGRVGYGPLSWAVDEQGKRAVTHYRVLGEASSAEGPLSLVELWLETGRTHQIRVHMTHIGHPLLGDAAYGRPSALIGRAALHSWRLRLTQPVTGEPIELEAPLPEDMAGLMDGWERGRNA